MNIAFTLTIDRQNPRIVIEKWEPVASDGQEHRTQQVMVYQGANSRLCITGAPLTIEFPNYFSVIPTFPERKISNFPRMFSSVLFGSPRDLKCEDCIMLVEYAKLAQYQSTLYIVAVKVVNR